MPSEVEKLLGYLGIGHKALDLSYQLGVYDFSTTTINLTTFSTHISFSLVWLDSDFLNSDLPFTHSCSYKNEAKSTLREKFWIKQSSQKISKKSNKL